jgi:AAA ATPase domain
MDPNANPFNPGAGTPPPELIGRDSILTQTDVILERIKRGRSERSLLLVGLRGVGKTVLLREIRRRAIEKNYAVEMIEAQEEQTITQLLVPALRRLLLELDSTKKTIAAVKRGLRVLRSFLSTIKVKASDIELTLGVDPEEGRADSGDLESDLKDLLLALGEASKETGRPIALLIDELQYLPRADLAALIRSLHAVAQESCHWCCSAQVFHSCFLKLAKPRATLSDCSASPRSTGYRIRNRTKWCEGPWNRKDPQSPATPSRKFTSRREGTRISCRNGGIAPGTWRQKKGLTSKWRVKQAGWH